MKLAVIYDSKTNNTAAVAGYMTEGMNSLEGVEAKTFLYSEVDTEFVKEFNKGLDAIKEDGTMKAILDKYGMGDSMIGVEEGQVELPER